MKPNLLSLSSNQKNSEELQKDRLHAARVRLPQANAAGMIELTPQMFQQLLANAGGHREPPVPKLWESEPAAWFQVFRGHYAPRNLSQQALFNALLPLVPASLRSVPFVYVRVDAVRHPLTRPYVGPFKVLSRLPKTFTLQRAGRPWVVSVDRLKPVIGGVDPVPQPDPAPAPAPPATSSSPPAACADSPVSPRPSYAAVLRSGRVSWQPARLGLP